SHYAFTSQLYALSLHDALPIWSQRSGSSIVPWCLRSCMWSHTSWSATQATCLSASSALGRGSQRMANRCPHLAQTTVPIKVLSEEESEVPRRRLATPPLFTNEAPGAGVDRGYRHVLHRRRDLRLGIRHAEPAVWLRSR